MWALCTGGHEWLVGLILTMKRSLGYPSSGCPKYTIDTSVLPYTAETAGYKFTSGKPRNATPARINTGK